jgi:hypothetical protein
MLGDGGAPMVMHFKRAKMNENGVKNSCMMVG